jgi:hypothetical protein
MGSRDRLQIVLRVPVWVKDNHYSRWGQVYTQASCAGRQQEDAEIVILRRILAAIIIKSLNGWNSILILYTAR